MKRILSPVGVLALLVTTGCGPRLVPVLQNGQMIPTNTDAAIAQAEVDTRAEQTRLAEAVANTTTDALASCAPAICDAIARGELAIGMSEADVLAATRTSQDAWSVRGSGGASVLTPAHSARAPRDGVGSIAFVSLQNGRVSGYTYREPNGLRMVASSADASPQGRARAQADALLTEGDALAAAGQLDLALDRYDRADVIRPNDSATTLRIASTLDKQLRPIEAILRYQLFIHQLELEKIEARGEAAARMAEAIARARERVVILDRQ